MVLEGRVVGKEEGRQTYAFCHCLRSEEEETNFST